MSIYCYKHHAHRKSQAHLRRYDTGLYHLDLEKVKKSNKRQSRIQTIISVIALFVSMVSLLTSWYSINNSREQWLDSGSSFSYLVDIVSNPNIIKDFQVESTPQKNVKLALFSISNTGRLRARVLTVVIKDSKGSSYTSKCGIGDTVIEAGDSAILTAEYVDFPEDDIREVFVITADGQESKATHVDMNHSHKDTYARSVVMQYAYRHLASEQNISCSVGRWKND